MIRSARSLAGRLAPLLAATLATVLGGPAPAADDEQVDLALVLAIDMSSSVDEDEFDLQLHGLSRAFQNPNLAEAIRSATLRGIAVAVVQWASDGDQRLVVDWTPVRDTATAAALARKIRNTPRLVAGGQTGISGAIGFSLRQFEHNRYASWRKVIDISGDGRANSGGPPAQSRDRAVAQGVTVNGLAIVNEEPFVDSYYRANVIGGPGAFVMVAEDYDDFAAAILHKLIREIGPPLAESFPRGRALAAATASGHDGAP